MQAVMTEKMNKYASGGSFETTIGKTTYLVNVFFNKENKATLDDRIKKMIRQDVKDGNF